MKVRILIEAEYDDQKLIDTFGLKLAEATPQLAPGLANGVCDVIRQHSLIKRVAAAVVPELLP